MEKRILVTGGTGFIGQALCPVLLEKGYSLTVLSRQPSSHVQALCGRVEAVSNLQSLSGHSGFDAVINLAGEGIADKRWSEKRKQALRDSRVALTATLADVIKTWPKPPEVVVSGSAVGFYGDQGSNPVTESTAPVDEFTHRMCRDWENQALTLEGDQTRICLSRTGIVVGPGGGFLKPMLLPFKLGLGGRIGGGQQFMPWVHRDDVVTALIWMLETPSASGAYNVVSPSPVTNRQFTSELAGVLRRPAVFPVPSAVLKVALGEMARLLLTGQQALPNKLTDEGFVFRYEDLAPALKDATRF